MPRPTRYGGQYVTEAEMNQLKEQNVSEFLQFKKAEDGKYLMQYKFPENGKGIPEGEEYPVPFKIRENMNLVYKSLASLYFDENGRFRTGGVDEGPLYQIYTQASFLQAHEISNILSIPEEKRHDFERFVNGAGKGILSVIASQMYDANNFIQNYSNALKGYEKSKDRDPETERYLRESYLDYERQIDDLKSLANMNPETEMEVRGHLDCEKFGMINTRLAEVTISVKPSLTNKIMESTKVNMNDMPPTDENGNVRAFTEHYCFTAPVKIDGQEKIISMEMTAPPDGKVIFRDENGKSATGIYDTFDQLSEYHRGRNYVPNKTRNAFNAVKQGTFHADMLTDEEKSYVYTSDRMKKLALGQIEYEERMETLSKADIPAKTYETLAKELNKSSVYSRIRGSSLEFDEMKTTFEKYGKEQSTDKQAELLEKLKKDAKRYLDGKDPKGDAEKEKELSSYAKNRIEFARNVYQLASAEINQSKRFRVSNNPGNEWTVVEDAHEAVKPGVKSEVTAQNEIEELSRIETGAKSVLENQRNEGQNIVPKELNRISVSALILSEIVRREAASQESPKLITELIKQKGATNIVELFSKDNMIREMVDTFDGPKKVDSFLTENKVGQLIDHVVEKARNTVISKESNAKVNEIKNPTINNPEKEVPVINNGSRSIH